MKVIGITGPRKLTRTDEYYLRPELVQLLKTTDKLHVGDADGVDAIAHEIALKRWKQVTLHETEGLKPYQLQQRSKRMVQALLADGGTLHAFVTKRCPEGVTVNSWAGSGTWGTMRYAIALGVPVELHWLIEPCELPDWLMQKQLSLV
jgi:hypothetical protein